MTFSPLHDAATDHQSSINAVATASEQWLAFVTDMPSHSVANLAGAVVSPSSHVRAAVIAARYSTLVLTRIGTVVATAATPTARGRQRSWAEKRVHDRARG
ncbi:hypothetical protein [Streptomyces sp. Qhu_M48]|uniref:hypothetical protein n=1 Tax=Streptomyces sp. Qhu_M48 TaxID=3435889 RepID=UPI003F4FDD9C